MSYTTAQTLLEELIGGVKDATALETHLGTAANKGVFQYLIRDEMLAPMLFDDETALAAIFGSTLARASVIESRVAMAYVADSMTAMIKCGDNATFLNELVLNGRSLLAFCKSKHFRAAFAGGARLTNFNNAAGQAGSKLKRNLYKEVTGGQTNWYTWARPAGLLWMYVMCIGAGGGGYTALGGQGGQAVAKVFDGENLPSGDQIIGVAPKRSTNNQGWPSFFGYVSKRDYDWTFNVDTLNDWQTPPLVVAGGGMANGAADGSDPNSGSYGEMFGDHTHLFGKLESSFMQDKEFSLQGQMAISTTWGGNTGLGPYKAGVNEFGGTGAQNATPAAGYGGGGCYYNSAYVAGGSGLVAVWHIED